MHYPQTNLQYQPTRISESQNQDASSHHSSHNASVEARQRSHNASPESRLPHIATTIGA